MPSHNERITDQLSAEEEREARFHRRTALVSDALYKTAVGGLWLSMVLTLVQVSSYTGERPRFANEPYEGTEELFNSLPVNPTPEEFKKIIEEIADGKQLVYGTDCLQTYVYHMQHDLDYIDTNTPARYISDATATEEGWIPVAVYSAELYEGAITQTDGIYSANNDAYDAWRSIYFDAWDYMDMTYGACGSARGNGYNNETGRFNDATGPVIYGNNVFYIKTVA